MPTFTSSATRRAALAFVAALAACTDDPTTSPVPVAPRLAAGDLLIVTSSSDGTGLGTLRWAVAQTTGGEVIRFDPSLAGDTIVVTEPIAVEAPIIIDAPAEGITISGGGVTRMLYLAANLQLRNVSLIDGKGTSGAAAAGIGSLQMENGAITGNDGWYALSLGGNITLRNVTVSGNRTDQGGPAIVGDMVLLDHATVYDNSGSGVFANRTVTLKNSIVAAHSGGNCHDQTGAISYEGRNLADDYSCGGLTSIIIADPKLQPLADNGGPGRTHALQHTSPAVNTGRDCGVREDQRHELRDGRCDLGAFESKDLTTVTLAISAGSSINTTTGAAIVTGTVQCTHDGERFDLNVALEQAQTSRRTGTATVRGEGFTSVQCGTTPRQWAVIVVPTAGTFQVGEAAASAETANMQPWVKYASTTGAVKTYFVRR
jgi:hypothetical protein